MSKSSPSPSHLPQVQSFLKELEWSTVKKYVEHLRRKGELVSIDRIDVDVPQIIRRRFLCDSRRCIQWAEGRPLVDRSCCSRYDVPITGRDREVVLQHLDQVRALLPAEARLRDPAEDPFQVDDDYGLEMIQDNPLGGCGLSIYQGGRCRCVLHHAALQRDERPHDWKPLACSLWPLALNSYDDDDEGDERILLTVYCETTSDIFDDEDEPFACIVDQDESYPPLYQSERSTLEYVFGEDWWQRLAKAAQRLERP